MDLDSDFTVIEKAGFYIVLCSREEPYVLSENADLFRSTSLNLLVYAETIELSGSIKLPGRTLGLFCQNLLLQGGADVIIDVSGANGARKQASAVGSNTNGDDGQDSGTVFICVESSVADLHGLQVRALGGDGAQGGASSGPEETSRGGVGGKGGNSGKITLLFNNKVHEVNSAFQLSMAQADSVSWHEKCLIAQEILLNQQLSQPHSSSLDFLVAVGKSLDLSASDMQDQSQLVQRLQRILEDLERYSGLNAYKALAGVLKEQQSAKSINAQLEASLLASTKKVLEGCGNDLSNQEDSLREDLNVRLDASPGRGGRGGPGASDLDPVGARGDDGQPIRLASSQCRYLRGPGDDFDAELDMPTFFPDQVRMLLKRADAQYLGNTPSSVAVARRLYERLTRRLYFVPLLASTAHDSAPMAKFIRASFEENFICIAPFSELRGVREEAMTRLARIGLGQDMFGQGPTWAPRLSYFYYQKRIEEMLSSYRRLAIQLDIYKKASDEANDKREAVSKVREMVSKEGASVQSRLDLILDENGPLLATAYRIRTFDPLMKDQQRHLKAQMKFVAGQIESSFNVSKVIDAFTTVASSKSQGEAAKNTAKASYQLYQAATVVEDADGKSIDKALLVKQVTTCGDTIESLQQAISANGDGSVVLEDPGALKVITTKDNIEKMLDQFRNILPESMRDTTNKQLKAFLETINSRNSAVLEYNSLSQVVQELQSTKKQQAVMIDKLSQQQLQKVDPGLPSIVSWLRKTRDDLSLAIMQQLNYANRAICYWGLVEGLPLENPGPLRGAIELEQIQKTLRQNFDACLVDYAGSAWNWWPTDGSLGQLYKLSPEQLNRLKTVAHKDEQGKAVYETNIMLSPDLDDMTGIGSDVRIRQIRLWLTNAYVDAAANGSGRRILTITLNHTGNEVIQKNETKSFEFTHSHVQISFRYHCDGVRSLQDAKTAAVYGQQGIENDFRNPTVSDANESAFAPLGPFTLWTATIREKDNPGLDLSKVDEAWLEFWGRSKPL